MGEEKLEEAQVDADRARKLIATEGATAIDLRDEDDFAGGHVPGAINVSEDDLGSRLDELSDDEPVIVICEDGKRSSDVAERLRDDGYQAASARGGMGVRSDAGRPPRPPD